MSQTYRGTEAELLALDIQPGSLGVASDTGNVIIGTGDSAGDDAILDPKSNIIRFVGADVAALETAHPAADNDGRLATLNVVGVFSIFFSTGSAWELFTIV